MNNKVKTVRFQEFKEATPDFLLTNKVDNNMLESILAYLATLINFKYTEENYINSKLYINDNFLPDSWHIGLYKFLMTPVRGSIIYGKQVSKEYLPFCGLVPLILAAHKKYNDIPYNKWSLDGLNIIVNKQLYELMSLKGSAPEFEKSYLIDLRDIGLIIKKESSAKYGRYKNPKTHYGLSGIPRISHPEFSALPKLAQIMLTQTWAAHPDNRNKYMILDLNDWDNMPVPLEESKVFTEESNEESSIKKKESSLDFNTLDLPWKI